MEGHDQLPNPFLHTVLEEVVKEEGLVNTRIKIESGSSKGDNYLSAVYKVTVNGQRADNGNKPRDETLTLILKCQPESKARRKEMRTSNYFNNEANFYSKVLPAFLTFQRERGVPTQDTFCSTAKCYRAVSTETTIDMEGAEEVLILEDMREQGYVMLDRRNSLDVTHCQLVLEHLAKLHAISFAMRDQKPEQFNSLKNSISETLFLNPPTEDLKNYIAQNQPVTEGALMTQVPGASIYKQRLHNFVQNYFEYMLKCVDGKAAEPYAVICHGDCWTNNLLFKYSKNDSKPIGITLLDFQISRYSSPVLDLSYFISCCTDQALRHEHYNFLLNGYYHSLAHFICQLGSDPQKLYPHDVFKEQLNKYSKFGFGMAIMALPAFTTEVDNVPDLDEMYNEGRTDSVVQLHAMTDNALYNERMSGVIVDTVDLGYI